MASPRDGETLLRGAVSEQDALHGVLDRIHSLGLSLLLVAQAECRSLSWREKIMQKLIALTVQARTQYGVFLGISILVVALTGVLYARNAAIFQPLMGRLNPMVAILIVVLLGCVLLTLVLSRGWFAVFGVGLSRGLLFASGVAALLGLLIVLVDLKAVFPADTNRPFPDSLLFYPVFGYIVEIVFHLLPLSLLLLVLTWSKRLSFGAVIWPCMIVVACIEPIFQTVLSASDGYPTWLTVYVFFHIYAINFLQLLTFKRYGLLSMFFFRLVYYAIWHLAWGHVRLGLLF